MALFKVGSVLFIRNFLHSLQSNPLQGVDLGKGLRKIRMSIASKGKGKSGGEG